MCSNIREEGGVCGISLTASQMTKLPTWNRNPHTGPVYPITGGLQDPRSSSHSVSSLGGVSTQEIRKSSRGTTGHGPRDYMGQEGWET